MHAKDNIFNVKLFLKINFFLTFNPHVSLIRGIWQNTKPANLYFVD